MDSSTPELTTDQRSAHVRKLQMKFSRKVSILLLPNNPSGTAFLNFILYYLKIWNIFDVDPQDIIAEAVYQGIKSIGKNQQPIDNPEAWLRVTCIYVMKKQVRSLVKRKKLTDNLMGFSGEIESPLTTAERFEWLDKLNEAIDQLPESDQELVRFRLFDEKTYEQIHYWLKLRDGEVPDIPTIRKRYSRAVDRLKTVFPSIYQEYCQDHQT
jgi:DNA-directed RNA polymerase specialized sigma24 family protein